MKNKFMTSSINFITKYNGSYTEEDIKKLNYGLEGLYLTISKTILIIVLAIVLNILKEVLLLLVLFNIIRYTGFGFHAEKSIQCLMFSTFNFIVIPFVLLNITISQTSFIIIGGLCTILIMLYAPSDTIKRPLPNKKKRLIRKIITTTVAIIYIGIGIVVNNPNLQALLLSTLIIQSIVIIPLTYKLFKQPYRNYKNYQKA